MTGRNIVYTDHSSTGKYIEYPPAGTTGGSPPTLYVRTDPRLRPIEITQDAINEPPLVIYFDNVDDLIAELESPL